MSNLENVLGRQDKYLATAFRLSDCENRLAASTSERLPKEVIDVHVHNVLKTHVVDIDERAYNHMLSTYLDYSIEANDAMNRKFHPGICVRSLHFGMVFRGLDYVEMNKYLAESCPPRDLVALFGVPDDIDYTINQLESRRYAALKMYYLYTMPTATSIPEIFTHEILSAAERHSVPIIIHLPKMLAFAIDDVLELKQKYPDIQATICHFGLTEHYAKEALVSFYTLAKETDFVMDTSMNADADVIRLSLDALGPERIMYGSDAPINMLRYVPYMNPEKGARIVTEQQYHWSDAQEYARYKHLARNATHAHWKAIGNLLTVIENEFSKNSDIIKKRIFCNNAKAWYGFS